MKLIVNANDFGTNRVVNQTIVDGINNKLFSSVSVMSNMPAFEDGMRKLQNIDSVDVGILLNVFSYKSALKTKEKNSKLYDKDGRFNNNFLNILLMSNDDDFMFEIEHEFRAQIENVLKYRQIVYIDSFRYVHAIPKIFDLVAKLAKEYEIPFVVSHKFGNSISECFKDKENYKFLLNKMFYKYFFKTYFLNVFISQNKAIIDKFDLISNDFVINFDNVDEFLIKNSEILIKKLKSMPILVKFDCNFNSKDSELLHTNKDTSFFNQELFEEIKSFEKYSIKNLK